MADAIKKTIRKIRHKFKSAPKLEPLWKKRQAEERARQLRQESWERDKKVVRGYNFEKAKRARAEQVKLINEEKQRKADIVTERLKNLKKARRKLAKMRKLGEKE